MELSHTPTEYILLRAETTSEDDSCHFVILHITESWRQTMLHRLDKAIPFNSDSTFSHLAFGDRPIGFYTFSDDSEAIFETVADWCFITVSVEEIAALDRVNCELCAHLFKIDSSGIAFYEAYAAHNEDRFYTHDFKMLDMLANTRRQ